MNSANNGFLCLNYGLFYEKIELNSYLNITFTKIENKKLFRDELFWSAVVCSNSKPRAEVFLLSLLSSLPQPIFYFKQNYTLNVYLKPCLVEF